MRRISSLLFLFVIQGCAASSEAPETGDEADLTSSQAVLASAFYVKASPVDQSSLGVVVVDGVAFAPGARSQSLPSITGFDHQPLPKLRPASVKVDAESSFDVLVGDSGRKAAPIFDASKLKVGMKCKVVGTDMDMYASGDPKTITLDVSIEETSPLVLAKSTKSIGGDGTLLVCDGKLAGIQSGAGSQGTWHEFRAVDAKVVAAFEKARDRH